MDFLANFMKEQTKAGGISKEISDLVEALWNDYKLPSLQKDCSIIDAEFGMLGSLVIKNIEVVEKDLEFKYEPRNYDYVDVVTSKTRNILWTDYENIEPYNRQSGLYCNGASFESLGAAKIEKGHYREFDSTIECSRNEMFAVWGYSFNNFYNSIQFGICIETKNVDEFVSKLRTIIGK